VSFIMTSDTTVLSPDLYGLLSKAFGSVLVANPGEPHVATTVTDPKTGRKREDVRQAGEEYRVLCPFCYDHGHHLYFNHRWLDKPFLANCYRGCLGGPSNRGRRGELRRKILSGAVLTARSAQAPATGTADPLADIDGPLPQVTFPGRAVPLNELPPDHHARSYLLGRGLDPDELCLRFGLSYCDESPNYIARGRIIVPIWMDGRMVGWQGRWPADLVKFDRRPKYYNVPQMPKRKMLYNVDCARLYRTVVVVEGVTDAWAVGGNAVAVFGKTLSTNQRRLLVDCWGSGHVVILLDGDAAEDAKVMAAELEPVMPGKVLVVDLPASLDPGSMDRDLIWQWVVHRAAEKGMTLDLNYRPPAGP
jgi:hypothetical protein